MTTTSTATTMPARPANVVSGGSMGVLMSLRRRLLRNRVRQAVRTAPLKMLASAVLLLVVWLALLGLFHWVFAWVQHAELAGPVAVRFVYDMFFAVLTALLLLSNCLLMYGSLFGNSESSFLLALPVRRRDIVGMSFMESLVLSSWSLVLLGVPLMIAYALTWQVPVWYHLFFVMFFAGFVMIPAALGTMLAVLVARYAPRRIRQWLLVGLIAAALAAYVLISGYLNSMHLDTNTWLAQVFEGIRFVRGPLLPSTWISQGLAQAAAGNIAQASRYLFVTVANGLFISLVAVEVSARLLSGAVSRASVSGSNYRANLIARWSAVLRVFGWLLPARIRLIIAKDLTMFFRDPVQWGQLAIVFGLLMLYLANIPTMRMNLDDPRWKHLIEFLNLAAVSLLLASFTGRFVYPLVSLESRTMWMTALLPVGRGGIVVCKCIFSSMITLAAGLTVMAATVYQVRLSWDWAIVQLSLTTVVCVGLCALATGLGARFATSDRGTDPARIASGFGGTMNLIISMVFVCGMLALTAVLALREMLGLTETALSKVLWVAGVIIGALIPLVVLADGVRRYRRAEL